MCYRNVGVAFDSAFDFGEVIRLDVLKGFSGGDIYVGSLSVCPRRSALGIFDYVAKSLFRNGLVSKRAAAYTFFDDFLKFYECTSIMKSIVRRG